MKESGPCAAAAAATPPWSAPSTGAASAWKITHLEEDDTCASDVSCRDSSDFLCGSGRHPALQRHQQRCRIWGSYSAEVSKTRLNYSPDSKLAAPAATLQAGRPAANRQRCITAPFDKTASLQTECTAALATLPKSHLLTAEGAPHARAGWLGSRPPAAARARGAAW